MLIEWYYLCSNYNLLNCNRLSVGKWQWITKSEVCRYSIQWIWGWLFKQPGILDWLSNLVIQLSSPWTLYLTPSPKSAFPDRFFRQSSSAVAVPSRKAHPIKPCLHTEPNRTRLHPTQHVFILQKVCKFELLQKWGLQMASGCLRRRLS